MPPLPITDPQYGNLQPLIGAGLGLLNGLAQRTQAAPVFNPYAPPSAYTPQSNSFLPVLASAAGGLVNGLNSQAAGREVLRQEQRGTNDALAAIALQSGLTVDDVKSRLTSGGQQILPKEYHSEVGTALGQGRANSAIADSLGLANAPNYYGADNTTANTIFSKVADALQNQATLPTVKTGITQGVKAGGLPGTPLDPFNWAPQIGNTFGMLGDARSALTGTYTAPKTTIPRTNFGTPTLDTTPPTTTGTGGTVAPNSSILAGGVTKGTVAETPATSLRDLFLSSPDPKEYRLGYQTGGDVMNTANKNRIDLYNNSVDNATKRQIGALDAVNDADRVAAYGRQVSSMWDALHSGTPEEKQLARTAILNHGSGGGSKGLTPAESAKQLNAIRTASLYNPEDVAGMVGILRASGASQAVIQEAERYLPFSNNPTPQPSPRPAPKPGKSNLKRLDGYKNRR